MLRVNVCARTYFACKSAMLHVFYAHVGAAIPVASTVPYFPVYKSTFLFQGKNCEIKNKNHSLYLSVNVFSAEH